MPYAPVAHGSWTLPLAIRKYSEDTDTTASGGTGRILHTDIPGAQRTANPETSKLLARNL